MAVSRKQALKKIRGTGEAIDLHLAKLRRTSDRHLIKFWLREIGDLIQEVRSLSELVGKRTLLEVMSRVIAWEQEIIEIEEADADA